MPIKQKFRWEQIYPYAIGLVLTFFGSRLDYDTPRKISDAGFSVPSFFSVSQNIYILATGILFSVFVFTMAPAAGFIAKLRDSKTFSIFRRYVIEALILGAIGIVFVIPLASAKDIVVFRLYWMHVFLGVTCFVGVSFVLAVYRVVRVFLFWSKL